MLAEIADVESVREECASLVEIPEDVEVKEDVLGSADLKPLLCENVPVVVEVREWPAEYSLVVVRRVVVPEGLVDDPDLKPLLCENTPDVVDFSESLVEYSLLLVERADASEMLIDDTDPDRSPLL